MSFDQGQFDFKASGGERGYLRWREELDARKRAFESRWGIILNRPARIRLRTRPRAIEGLVHMIEEPGTPKNHPPRLKLGTHEFPATDIISIVAIEATPTAEPE